MHARPHFHVAGIPVRVEPLFWLATVFLAYGLGDARLIIMWVAVVFVSILVHELGHAVALRAFGQSSSIVLHGFGGLTFSQRRLDRVRSIAVSLAGPFAALALLGIPALLLRDSGYGQELQVDYRFSGQVFGLWPVIFFAVYVNIWWSIANLLPIRPLDGGNVVTELIGLQPARLLSGIVGAAAAVWAYTHSDGFRYAAFFAGFLAVVNLSEWTKARRGERAPSAFDVEGPSPKGGGGQRPGQERPGGPTPSSRRSPSRDGWPTGPPSTSSRGDATVAHLGGGVDPSSAASMAWNLLRSGDVAGARRVVARATGPVDPFVTGTLSLAEGDGVDALVAAYLAAPGGPSNLVPAAVAADSGQVESLARQLVGAGTAGVDAATGLQTHLHYAERFGAAAVVGALVYEATPTGRAQVAFDVACSTARAGDAERSLRWVERAVEAGFRAPGLLDNEPDLAPVRALPGWADVRNRL